MLSRDTRLKIRPLKRVSPIPRLIPFMEYSGRPNPDQARAQARLLKCAIKFDPMPSAEAKCQVATAQCHRQWSAKMPKAGCYYLEGEEQDQTQGLRQLNAQVIVPSPHLAFPCLVINSV